MQAITEFIKKHGDPFEILEIEVTTDKKTVKQAYKEMAKKHHPDKNRQQNNNDKFIKLKMAYDFIISNLDNYKHFIEAKKLRTAQYAQQSKIQKQFSNDLLQREKDAQRMREQVEEFKQMKIREQMNRLKREKEVEEQKKKNAQKKKAQFDLEHDDSYRKLNTVKVKWGSDMCFTEQLLEAIFKSYGPIKEIKLKENKALIWYHTTEAANRAVELSPMKTKFQMKQDKRKQLQEFLRTAKERLDQPEESLFTLSSDTLNRISNFYNKDSVFIDESANRENERQRMIDEIYQEELNR